jgi:hypothetical protein
MQGKIGSCGLSVPHVSQHRANVGISESICGVTQSCGIRSGQMKISGWAYLVAGITALYVALAPVLSGLANRRPVWAHVLLWVSASFMLYAASQKNNRHGTWLAFVGSCIILGRFVYWQFVRLGYVHVTTRLIAVQEHSFDRWRLMLDRPMLFLLFVSSLLSFFLAVHNMFLRRAKVENP